MRRTLTMLFTVALLATIVPPASARNPHGTWQVLNATGDRPAVRKHHTMVYDVASNRVVLYGGETIVNGQDVVLGDVWVLDLNGTSPSWVQWTPQPDPAINETPGVRHGHSAIYLGGPPRMIVFAGRSGFAADRSDTRSDVWSLSLTGTPQWTRLSTGPGPFYVRDCSGNFGCAGEPGYMPRSHTAAVALNGQMFFYGGQPKSPPVHVALGDAWLFAPPNSFSMAFGYYCPLPTSDENGYHCPEVRPEHRYWHSLIVDDNTTVPDRLVIFGGIYPEAPSFSNVWMSADGGSNWAHLGEAPGEPVNYKRGFHTAVYDPLGDRMVVVGGYDVTQSDPFPIFGTATAVDLPDQVTYVQNGSVNPNHPWYTLGTAGSALGNIAEHAAVYDSQNDRIIAFGGVLNRVDNIANFRSNDVWALHFRGPDAITNLDLSCLGQTGLILSFTAPVSPYGAAVEYDVRYSPSPITQENFASATQVATEPLPEAPGTPQTVGIGGLTKCKWYWFAMRTRDEHGNWSAISNVYTVRTKCSGGGSCPLAESVVEPTTTSLSRAFPNPARQVTRFTLTFSRADEGAEYSLAIFDVAGRRVKEIGGGAAPLGEISVGWDLRGDGGHAIEPGLYYARLEIGTRRMTQPVLVTP